MSELERAALYLSAFFGRHDIPTERLSVILRVADRNAASRLDYALRNTFKAYEIAGELTRHELRAFRLAGLDFKIESPLVTD